VEKRESESFTKVIAKFLKNASETHTGAAIAAALSGVESLPHTEVEKILAVVRENRAQEKWDDRDLR